MSVSTIEPIEPSVFEGRTVTCLEARLRPDGCQPKDMMQMVQGLGGDYFDRHYFVVVLYHTKTDKLNVLLYSSLLSGVVGGTFGVSNCWGFGVVEGAEFERIARVEFEKCCALLDCTCCLLEVKNSRKH